jgi:hypothetical protein
VFFDRPIHQCSQVKIGFGASTVQLGLLSFRLHKELAEQNDGHRQWGYSRSTGASVVEGDPNEDQESGDDWLFNGRSRAELAAAHEFHSNQEGPAWLGRKRGDDVKIISEDNSVAQV